MDVAIVIAPCCEPHVCRRRFGAPPIPPVNRLTHALRCLGAKDAAPRQVSNDATQWFPTENKGSICNLPPRRMLVLLTSHKIQIPDNALPQSPSRYKTASHCMRSETYGRVKLSNRTRPRTCSVQSKDEMVLASFSSSLLLHGLTTALIRTMLKRWALILSICFPLGFSRKRTARGRPWRILRSSRGLRLLYLHPQGQKLMGIGCP